MMYYTCAIEIMFIWSHFVDVVVERSQQSPDVLGHKKVRFYDKCKVVNKVCVCVCVCV